MEVGLLLIWMNMCLSLSVTQSTDGMIVDDTLRLEEYYGSKEAGARNVRSAFPDRTFKRHQFKRRRPKLSIFSKTTTTTTTESITFTTESISSITESILSTTVSIPTSTTSRTTTTKKFSLRRLLLNRSRAKATTSKSTTLLAEVENEDKVDTTSFIKESTTSRTTKNKKPTTLLAEEENVSQPLAAISKLPTSDSAIFYEVNPDSSVLKEKILNRPSDIINVENVNTGRSTLTEEEIKFEDKIDTSSDTRSFFKESLLTKVQEHISNALFADFEDSEADPLIPSETYDSSTQNSHHSSSEILSAVDKYHEPLYEIHRPSSVDPLSTLPPLPRQHKKDLNDETSSPEEDGVNEAVAHKAITSIPRTTLPTTGTTTKVPRKASKLFSQRGRSNILATSSRSTTTTTRSTTTTTRSTTTTTRSTTTTTSITPVITSTTVRYEESVPGLDRLVGIISSDTEEESNPITTRKQSTTTTITTSTPERSNQIPLCPDSVSTYIIPHQQLCDSFFLCQKGQLSTRVCAIDLIFSLTEAECVPPKSGDCVDRPHRSEREQSQSNGQIILEPATEIQTKSTATSTTTITTTSTTTTSPEVSCPDSVYNYLIPHPVQCDSFYICREGLVSSRLCPDGLVLSKSQLKCVLPSLGDCEERPQQQPPSGTGPCIRQNGVFFPNESCTDYITCRENNPSWNSCAKGLVFDTQRKICAWPDEVLRPGCLPGDLLNFRCPNPILSIEDALASGVQLEFGDHSRHPDLTDCRSFFLCLITGHPRKSGCGSGLVFSPISRLCRPPAEVPGCEHYYKLRRI